MTPVTCLMGALANLQKDPAALAALSWEESTTLLGLCQTLSGMLMPKVLLLLGGNNGGQGQEGGRAEALADDGDLLTPAAAAIVLKVTARHVQAMCRDGRLPGAFKLPGGKLWRIPRKVLQKPVDTRSSGTLQFVYETGRSATRPPAASLDPSRFRQVAQRAPGDGQEVGSRNARRPRNRRAADQGAPRQAATGDAQ